MAYPATVREGYQAELTGIKTNGSSRKSGLFILRSPQTSTSARTRRRRPQGAGLRLPGVRRRRNPPCILVVRAGVTRLRDLEAAANALGHARVPGIALNAVDTVEIRGEGYYNHYHGGELARR